MLNFNEMKKNNSYSVNSEFRIYVISTMSSGKSTLVNALLGKNLIPIKNEMCTSTITEILDNDQEVFDAVAYNQDDVALQKFSKLTYDIMDKLNENEEVYRITVNGSISFLDAEGIATMLIDTPAPNISRSKMYQEMGKQVFANNSNNLFVYVLNGTQLLTSEDTSLLAYLADLIKKNGEQIRDRVLFVLNKMDLFDSEEDIRSVVMETKRYLEAYGIEDPQIFPCSAYTALNIQTYFDGIDIDNLTRAEERKLSLAARETLFVIDDFINCEAMHLEQYSSLSQNMSEELNYKLSLAKENEDTKEQALIHCGIYSIEAVISEYVKKYAKLQQLCEPDRETIKRENVTNGKALPEVNIQDSPIEIGSVSVLGDTRDKLTIKLIDEDGKVYCFKSDGNEIVTYKIGGRLEKKYERR